MPISRAPARASVVDVLDHVLDKGIVVDALMRVSVAPIDLLNVDAHVVVDELREKRARPIGGDRPRLRSSRHARHPH